MRLISVPKDLTLLSLLEFGEIQVTLEALLREQVQHKIQTGLYEEALSLSERIFTTAWADHNRYVAALALLHQTDIFYRLQRWEEALDSLQRALNWLEQHVTQVARYNEAITIYFEGILHYILQADAKTIQAFMRAQRMLVESERYWGYENNPVRVRDCQNVTRWMTHLRELQPRLNPGEFTMAVPLYEKVDQGLIRTGVIPIAPFQVAIPGEILAANLPAHIIPLETDALPFLQLRPDAHYLALKITTKAGLIPKSKIGDVLLIETASTQIPTKEIVLSSAEPFIRRSDGRILFRPHQAQVNNNFVGIPRVLIREEEVP